MPKNILIIDSVLYRLANLSLGRVRSMRQMRMRRFFEDGSSIVPKEAAICESLVGPPCLSHGAIRRGWRGPRTCAPVVCSEACQCSRVYDQHDIWRPFHLIAEYIRSWRRQVAGGRSGDNSAMGFQRHAEASTLADRNAARLGHEPARIDEAAGIALAPLASLSQSGKRKLATATSPAPKFRSAGSIISCPMPQPRVPSPLRPA